MLPTDLTVWLIQFSDIVIDADRAGTWGDLQSNFCMLPGMSGMDLN